MTTTTTTTAPATTPAPKGFPGLSCLLCGKSDSLSLDLETLTSFHCSECEESIDIGDVREQLRLWSSVLRWIELAPAQE
jgi:hypothetical protein